ncbi:hypothetical protein N7535_007451 [Penicillium sp. DV-2018c]|nr:hypothetical protein N7461_003479 [Penicillium sp. DV-2018c]KAJ5565813.1 hypothetical protein N7535_007451 [Penicillium sp. DV-2018c]
MPRYGAESAIATSGGPARLLVEFHDSIATQRTMCCVQSTLEAGENLGAESVFGLWGIFSEWSQGVRCVSL